MIPNSQVCQKRGNVLFPQLIRVAFVMEENKLTNPMNVTIFRAPAVMPHPDRRAYLIEKFRCSHASLHAPFAFPY